MINKSSRNRIIESKKIIMQPRLAVGILVLQAEWLVSAIRYFGFALQFAPAVIIPEPNQVAVLIGHLSWDADLVAVEVAGLLSAFAIFGCPIADLRERFVGILVGVDIGISAV